MAKDKIFCDGLRVTEKQVSEIKLGIQAEKFMEFIAKYTNDKGYVNIDIKTSKNGGYYAELNTYGLNNKEGNIVNFEETEEVSF